MFKNNYRTYRETYMQTNRMNTSRSRDYGPEPFATNIKEVTLKNENFRAALWTGEHLQITLMCINSR